MVDSGYDSGKRLDAAAPAASGGVTWMRDAPLDSPLRLSHEDAQNSAGCSLLNAVAVSLVVRVPSRGTSRGPAVDAGDAHRIEPPERRARRAKITVHDRGRLATAPAERGGVVLEQGDRALELWRGLRRQRVHPARGGSGVRGRSGCGWRHVLRKRVV